MAGQKRTSTNYKCIYFNEDTKRYDVKYNYKVYDPLTKKNKTKSKWSYNLRTIAEAKAELAKLQTGSVQAESKDITLEGIFELWKIKANGQNFSQVTVNNTTQHMNMIYQFLPKDTKLKDITEDVYYKFCSDCREHKYADETLRSINASFRKMINLAHKKKLISTNILDYADNIRTRQKSEYRTISKEEFDILDKYFATNKFVRRGEDVYRKYRLLVNILYFTGVRIGECLALTYEDLEEFDYYKKSDKKPIILEPSEQLTEAEHLHGWRLVVNKAYVSDIKITKDPKNFKHRKIPMHYIPAKMFMKVRRTHLDNGGTLTERIFKQEHSAVNNTIGSACAKNNLPEYNCHEFRHTFISNLISYGVPLPVIEKVSGDTQETILKRYSHMFEQDEVMVLKAMQNL